MDMQVLLFFWLFVHECIWKVAFEWVTGFPHILTNTFLVVSMRIWFTIDLVTIYHSLNILYKKKKNYINCKNVLDISRFSMVVGTLEWRSEWLWVNRWVNPWLWPGEVLLPQHVAWDWGVPRGGDLGRRVRWFRLHASHVGHAGVVSDVVVHHGGEGWREAETSKGKKGQMI